MSCGGRIAVARSRTLLIFCLVLALAPSCGSALIIIAPSQAVGPVSSGTGDGLTSGYIADPANLVCTLAEADALVLAARTAGTLDIRTIPNIDCDLRTSSYGLTNPFGPYMIDFDYKALQFNGYINIKAAGDYMFAAAVDDGARLRIGGTTIFALDGGHWFDSIVSDTVHFDAAGLYPVDIVYYDGPYCCYGFRLGAIGPAGSGLLAYSPTYDFAEDLGHYHYGGHPGNSVIPQSLFFTTQSVKIGVARRYVDGSQVRFEQVVVTAVGGPLPSGVMYVEEPDRSAGIRVRAPVTQAVGSRVRIDGVLATEGAERVILATAQYIAGGGQIAALGMAEEAVGGKAAPPVPDLGAANLYNVGLRICVWGRVSGSVPGQFVLNDGSASTLKVLAPGVSPLPADGSYVRVVGICGAEVSTPANIPVVRLMSASDWSTL